MEVDSADDFGTDIRCQVEKKQQADELKTRLKS